MYFTDDSLLPENQAPLMITAAPYGSHVATGGLHAGTETSPHMGRADSGRGGLL